MRRSRIALGVVALLLLGAPGLRAGGPVSYEMQLVQVPGLNGFAFFGDLPRVADMNNDGSPDVVVVATGQLSQGTLRGVAYVLFGPSLTSFQLVPNWPAVDLFGSGDLRVLDLDGDGFVDVLHGSGFADGAKTQAGRLFVTWGPALNHGIELKGPSPQAFQHFGAQVRPLDLDHDGLIDLAVSTPDRNTSTLPSSTNVGRVDFYLGSSGWTDGRSSDAFDLPLLPAPIGGQVLGGQMGVGDIDNDGLDDLVASEVHLFDAGMPTFATGGASLLSTPATAFQTFVPPPPSALSFPASPVVADVDGDGVNDLIGGSPITSGPGGESTAGAVDILFGPMFSTAARLYSPKPRADAKFGQAVAVGDANRDGFLDILAGSWNDSPFPGATPDNAGRAFLLLGPTFSQSQEFGGQAKGDFFALSLTMEDIDEDGFPDLLISASGYHDIGALEVFRHRALSTPAVPRIPLQTGASLPLDVAAGDLSTGDAYLILASLSGSQPGLDLPGGVHVPLVLDAFTQLFLAFVNTPALPGFAGTLAHDGAAQATLHWPPGAGSPALLGQTLTLVAVSGPGFVTFASTPLDIAFVP